MCPTVYSSVYTSSLANVHFNESLVSFQVSGVCDTINIGWSLTGTLPGYPVVFLCPGEPIAFDQQDWQFHKSQPSEDDIDFGVGPLGALDLCLGGS